jgi:two-component system, LytTR family, response regulator
LKIRALIVDDEPLARSRIKTFLQAEPQVEVVGECSNGEEALEAIQQKAPGLLFLDIQMPGLNGFEVLEALEPQKIPAVIFVTAYDQYALKAFEVHAVDYLLKPFDRERFSRALGRAKEQSERQAAGGLNQHILALLEDLKGNNRFLERIVTKSGGRIFFLRVEEIDWIEAEGNYVRLHCGGESHLLRETMSGLETKLDPKRFLRIHRSTIMNIERVKELQPWFRGDYVVILRDGTKLTLSRGYRDRLETLLGRPL